MNPMDEEVKKYPGYLKIQRKLLAHKENTTSSRFDQIYEMPLKKRNDLLFLFVG